MPCTEKFGPNSTVALQVTLKTPAGAPITTATVTATVYNPSNQTILTDVTLPHVGAGVYEYKVDEALTTAVGMWYYNWKAVFASDQLTGQVEFLIGY